MPSLREHIRLSRERTGEEFRELNEWLDGEGVSFLSKIDRHIRMGKHSRYVEERWGKMGLREYRNHVNDDIEMILLLIHRLMGLGRRRCKEE
ncbi:MAG: metal dependent phosphohydrolase [Candidatus Bathyarchaeota archaeon B63]|nr:MAG: metal dependent phosphohydrolase [Candidatus Bathyarchaeota archaeon B63]